MQRAQFVLGNRCSKQCDYRPSESDSNLPSADAQKQAENIGPKIPYFLAKVQSSREKSASENNPARALNREVQRSVATPR
jgi:hypothetical protein